MNRLRRVLGVRGAVVVGLGAMLGTGVFAAWTPAADLAGGALLWALGLAAVVAALNATSTAALARALPESGGAYAYGRTYLSRPAGVVAGYAFVIGKSASAGAAALTIGAYAWPGQERLVGLLAIVVALALDLRGVVKSVRVSAVLVVAVLAILAWLAVSAGVSGGSGRAVPLADGTPLGLLAASGILFVAFAGYARITVLGEEVRDPRRNIPIAMAISFTIIITTYVVIAIVVVRSLQAGVELSAAPLEAIADAVGSTALVSAVRVAAVIAAGAVLLSLIAGIGRTLFAMGRGGDAPRGLAAVSAHSVPWRADVLAALLGALVVIIGGIALALALSAATILTYYAVAHLAVLARVMRGAFPRRLGLTAALGLVGCVGVVAGLVLAALG
jgi:APA family basic amino acid/polyamine antiporter